MYPTPVWGTAGVPGYGTGPFVPSGYKWTARTTELHPDGECKHRPPEGETPGEGTRADDKDPPPPTTAGKAQTRHQGNTAPSDAESGQREEGTQRGRGGGLTTNRLQPGRAGNHTAETGEGPRHTAPTPTQSRQTKPRKARTGTQTHHQHTAHTPAHAHNTHHHNRHRHEPHKRTPHPKAQAPPAPQTQHTQTLRTTTRQPPARRAAGPPETPLGHKAGPTKPSARRGERPHPATPNRPRPTPGASTTTPTPALPPTPQPDAPTPSPAGTPGTNGDTVGNTGDPSPQHNT